MENLPYELLVDICHVLLNVDAMTYIKSSKCLNYISRLYVIQNYIINDCTKQSWNRKTIALNSSSYDKFFIPANTLFLKIKMLTDSRINSIRLQHLFIERQHSCITDNNKLPNLRTLKCDKLYPENTSNCISRIILNTFHYTHVRSLQSSIRSLTLRESTPYVVDMHGILSLPKLTHLKLHGLNNNSIRFQSTTITHLTLDENFKTKITQWPINLIYLEIGNKFYENNDSKILPKSLIYFIDKSFSRTIKLTGKLDQLRYLFANNMMTTNNKLTNLEYISCININAGKFHRIVFSPSVISLKITNLYHSNIEFPPTLKKLHLDFMHMSDYAGGSSLIASVRGDYDVLLEKISNTKIIYLKIRNEDSHQSKTFTRWLDSHELPSLKYLITNVNGYITSLPINLEYLSLNHSVNILCLRQSKLTHLKIYQLSTYDPFPNTLLCLEIRHNLSTFPELPENLKKLKMHSYLSNFVPQLPKHLTHLTFDMVLDSRIKLPQSLIYLKIPYSQNYKIPKTIKTVILFEHDIGVGFFDHVSLYPNVFSN